MYDRIAWWGAPLLAASAGGVYLRWLAGGVMPGGVLQLAAQVPVHQFRACCRVICDSSAVRTAWQTQQVRAAPDVYGARAAG